MRWYANIRAPIGVDAMRAFIAHLPSTSVQFDACWNLSDSVAPLRTPGIGQVQLQGMRYEEWAALDPGYGDGFDYNQSQPAFICCELVEPAESLFGVDAAMQAALDRIVATLHDALMLVGCRPLPPPKLSCAYERMAGERATVFRVGLCGREWIVSGHYLGQRLKLQHNNLAGLRATLLALQRLATQPAAEALRSALQTLRLVGTPDAAAPLYGAPDRRLAFVMSVAALEALLVDDGAATGTSVSQRLARRLETILGNELPQLRQLYGWRSDLLHGRPAQRDSQPSLRLGPGVLALVLRRLLGTIDEPWFDAGIGAGLDRIADDPAWHARWRELLAAGDNED